jgi:hypothetical protein
MSIKRHFPILSLAVGLTAGLSIGGAGAASANDDAHACYETAALQLTACKAEVRSDFFVAQAICENVPGEAAQDDCEGEANLARGEALVLCGEQRTARLALCADLGDGRYDPNFEPALFDDPKQPSHPNPYFPLQLGNRWVFEGGGEHVTVTVLNETKLIEGVTCLTVHDLVEVNGASHEDTDDWYGQRKDGTVDYCGEISQSFESFIGDVPAGPELTDLHGSWKAGRDGALPGAQFLGAPRVGQVYRQEFAPGVAEDAAEVLSTSYRFGRDADLDRFVPPALALRMCSAGDCIVTGEFTPVEPDAFQHKFYARGVGLFLEVDPVTGDITQLVECNTDPKCNGL